MRRILLIGAGGFLGAVSRLFIKNVDIVSNGMLFPINTFLINITGTFLLALILTVALEIVEFDVDLRIGVTTGFLGAYTTFSTLCKEAVNFIMTNHYDITLAYLSLSMIVGLGVAYLGVVIARFGIVKFVADRKINGRD